MKPKAILIISLILLVGVSAAYYRAVTISSRDNIPTSLMGSLWPDPQPLPEFQLTDHLGNAFGLDQLRGNWTLIFFGYTSCPDICPTTMMTLDSTVAELAKTGAVMPNVVMVTIDPERDDAATLAQYVSYFNEDFLGVRGEEKQLHNFVLKMGAMYSRGETGPEGGYDMAHSASVFLVDPKGRKFGMFSPPHIPELMAENLVQIQEYYEHDQ